jgi:hypothetical protein
MNSIAFHLAYASKNPAAFAQAQGRRSTLFRSKHFWTFADNDSEADFERAIRNAPMRDVPNPIVIITGPSASGKTLLAKAMIRHHHGDDDPRTVWMDTSAKHRKTLFDVLDQGLPYVFLDNCFDATELKHLKLYASFTAISHPSSRRFPYIKRSIAPPRIYVCTPPGTSLPLDLVRRAWIIELQSPPGILHHGQVPASSKSKLARAAFQSSGTY